MADETCDDDHDGYAIIASDHPNDTPAHDPYPGGDCNDADPLVNPGAFDVVGNMVDDNCDGSTDEQPDPCVLNVPKDDPRALAAAIELCAPWLIDASVNPLSDLKQKSVRAKLGKLSPKQGTSFAMLSSGLAVDESDAPSGWLPQPGTPFQSPPQPNPDVLTSRNICTNSMQTAAASINDLMALTLKIKVPTNAFSFTFNFNFYTAEYAETVGNQYNDQFLAVLDSKKVKGNAMLQCGTNGCNVSFDANGEPITVNNGFFTVCDSSPVCGISPDCVNCGNNCPLKCGHTCTKTMDNPCGSPAGPGHCGSATWELDGSGYEIDDGTGVPIGGATGWLTTTAPVQPGETITLTFAVFDAGDNLWVSSVIIDNFQWQVNAADNPSTIP
jgi:hypothetical protein